MLRQSYHYHHPLTQIIKAYIISNASKFIFPSQQKVGDDRFGLFNLNGANTRDLNYCSVPSIADNQPTCSVTVDKTASTETYPRSHEYDLEMSVEAEDAIGQIYFICDRNDKNQQFTNQLLYICSIIYAITTFNTYR